ncbi:hypothetical protein IMSAGC004_02611 [Bacteroidaceae bacterium]|nr:hypothetical protein IMSAGC004_02611 [Bacteroidaceae bacterium]
MKYLQQQDPYFHQSEHTYLPESPYHALHLGEIIRGSRSLHDNILFNKKFIRQTNRWYALKISNNILSLIPNSINIYGRTHTRLFLYQNRIWI